MDSNIMLSFGLKLIDLLKNDPRAELDENCFKLYLDGITSEDKKTADFIANANMIYHNSEDPELHGNYLTYEILPENGTDGVATMMRYNLEPCYEKAKESGVQPIIDDFIEQFNIQKNSTNFDERVLSKDYSVLRENLMLRMLNFPRNCVRLKDTVYDRVGDMAVCAYIRVSHEGGNLTSTKVTKQILDMYGVSSETVMADAVQNAQKLFPDLIYFNILDSTDPTKGHSVKEAARLVEKGERKLPSFSPTLVLTVRGHLNGASALFYPGVQENLSKITGGDFYAVCTSIHEIMIHPKNGFKPSMLKENLYDTNKHFGEAEMLTELIYRYDSRRRQLREA